MRRWTVELTERELRTILAAFDVAAENAPLKEHRRYWQTKNVRKLYERLRDHGLGAA